MISSAAREPAAAGSARVMGVVRRRRARVIVRGVVVRGVPWSCAVIMPARRRRAARIARTRAGERDQPRQDRAEQRQEDDRLIHAVGISPSSD